MMFEDLKNQVMNIFACQVQFAFKSGLNIFVTYHHFCTFIKFLYLNSFI